MRAFREKTQRYVVVCLAMTVIFFGSQLSATIFGSVRGVVHDPQHRPIAGATVILKPMTSGWSQKLESDQDGEFIFSAVAIGDYTITADKTGFATEQQSLTVVYNTTPVLHFQLR